MQKNNAQAREIPNRSMRNLVRWSFPLLSHMQLFPISVLRRHKFHILLPSSVLFSLYASRPSSKHIDVSMKINLGQSKLNSAQTIRMYLSLACITMRQETRSSALYCAHGLPAELKHVGRCRGKSRVLFSMKNNMRNRVPSQARARNSPGRVLPARVDTLKNSVRKKIPRKFCKHQYTTSTTNVIL
jgi:hypothetical protein